MKLNTSPFCPFAAQWKRMFPSGRAHAQTDTSSRCSRSPLGRSRRVPALLHLSKLILSYFQHVFYVLLLLISLCKTWLIHVLLISRLLLDRLVSVFPVFFFNSEVRFSHDMTRLGRPMRPEDHWSCIAHLSSENMLNLEIHKHSMLKKLSPIKKH